MLSLYSLALSLTLNLSELTSINITASTNFYQTQQIPSKKKDSRKRSNCDASNDSCKSK